MGLPGKIKIGGIDFEIMLVPGKSEVLKYGEAIGFITEDECKIYISQDIHEQKQQETLVHEILHAIFDYSGIEDKIHSEMNIEKIGRVLYQVLKDNDLYIE